jgi:hypothetical protein
MEMMSFDNKPPHTPLDRSNSVVAKLRDAWGRATNQLDGLMDLKTQPSHHRTTPNYRN